MLILLSLWILVMFLPNGQMKIFLKLTKWSFYLGAFLSYLIKILSKFQVTIQNILLDMNNLVILSPNSS